MTYELKLLLPLVLAVPSEDLTLANPADHKRSSKSLHEIQRHSGAYTPSPARHQRIQLGAQVLGELARSDFTSSRDGTRVDMFRFRGHGGDVVTVSVQSEAFDPLVWVLESRNLLLINGDDDSGDGLDARLTTVLPRDGDYLLAVNSYGRLGNYEVGITEEPALVVPDAIPNSTMRAVLVGINDYPGDRHDLSAPVHDVDAVFKFLVAEAGFDPREILPIRDAYATRENIAQSVRSFLGTVGADGTALLYFSGHGIWIGARDGQESDRRDEALFLADGTPLVDDELRELVKCIDAKFVTVIVDACYSGGIHRGTGQKSVKEAAVRQYLEPLELDPVEATECQVKLDSSRKEVDLVIAASQEHEEAWEWDQWDDITEPRSVFTRYLIEQASYALKNVPDMRVESLIEQVSLSTTRFTQEHVSAFQHGRLVNYSRREVRVGEMFGLSGASGPLDRE